MVKLIKIYKGMYIGDEIVCINDKLPYITNHNSYYIENIFREGKNTYFSIVDDGSYISSYKTNNFKSISVKREEIINNLINI